MSKKIIISILSVLLVIAGISYFVWSSNVKEKAKEVEKDNEVAYEKKISDTLDKISESTGDSAVVASIYQKYWNLSIRERVYFYKISDDLNMDKLDMDKLVPSNKKDGHTLRKGEFNAMLSIVKAAKSNEIESILEKRDSIAKTIKSLNNPSENFKDNYESLLDVYEMYDAFVSISTSPVGSYTEYSKNINNSFEKLSSKIKTVRLKL